MCIDLKTSLISLGIGELSGLLLTTKTEDKKVIGLFIMFYSLVQFFEANMYYYGSNASDIYSRLLLLNLGFQGIVFFYLLSSVIKIDSIYFIICGLISLYILLESIKPDFKAASISNCIKWNFITDEVTSCLFLMYLTMFYWMYFDPKVPANLSISKESTDFINLFGIFFTITFGVSYFLNRYSNTPGIWCLMSTLTAPILLLF